MTTVLQNMVEIEEVGQGVEWPVVLSGVLAERAAQARDPETPVERGVVYEYGQRSLVVFNRMAGRFIGTAAESHECLSFFSCMQSPEEMAAQTSAGNWIRATFDDLRISALMCEKTASLIERANALCSTRVLTADGSVVALEFSPLAMEDDQRTEEPADDAGLVTSLLQIIEAATALRDQPYNKC